MASLISKCQDKSVRQILDRKAKAKYIFHKLINRNHQFKSFSSTLINLFKLKILILGEEEILIQSYLYKNTTIFYKKGIY